jgi:putative DNA primase/helicase
MQRYIVNVLELLKELLSASPDEFDAHPNLLNCSNCVVDLEDGTTMPHAPELRMTKLCLTNYVSGARSELWECLLREVFLGDQELITYMQRALGYSITGEARKQKIFICYGTGANGRTTLFETLLGVLGDYAQTVPMCVLRRDELSRKVMFARTVLQGVRLVLLPKIPEGGQLDKALAKLFVAGDRVTARYPHHEPFEFTLQAKFWLSVDCKPRITDPALLHRVVVIPFRAVFTNDPNVDPAIRRDPDPLIKEKLLQSPHREAILAWLVQGAIAWYQNGLQEPDIVRAATEECWCGPKS